MEAKALLTVSEAAERLGIGRSHAYEFVMRGEIRSVRIGRSRRIVVSDLDDFIERLREEAGVAS